ncbi:MAG: PP2C family protein-serine/threonine phosphatase [Lachnospirales bacterium]
MYFTDIGYVCDIGNVRKENQDRIVVLKNKLSTLCAVADGMGGMNKGSFASRFVITQIADMWKAGHLNNLSKDKIIEVLYEVITNINNELKQYSAKYDVKMGTTLTLLYIQNNFAIIAYSGDTRLYIIRDNTVKQLTEDETLYNYYEKYEENSCYNDKNNKSILFSYIGKVGNLTLNLKAIDILKDDAFVICSDGAYNYLNIHSNKNLYLVNNYNASDIVKQWTADIKNSRASDNFSIIVVKCK